MGSSLHHMDFVVHELFSCGMWAYLPRGMWNLSSPTRDQAYIPCITRQILNHWTTREVPPEEFLYETMNMFKWSL